MARSIVGRFVRHDLMSTDTDAAGAFYSALFGWTVERYEAMPGFKATRFTHEGATLGGLVPFDAQPQLGAHWISYVAVDDIAATCAAARVAAGAVCVQPFTLPGLGTFAVLEDPLRAFISPLQLEDPSMIELPERPTPGRFCWNQLLTADPAAVVEFYTACFGWTLSPDEMGGLMITRDGVELGSVMPEPGGARPSQWLPYVAVDDCAASEKRASELGAGVRVPRVELPGIGAFAVLADPTGAQFAMWQDHEG